MSPGSVPIPVPSPTVPGARGGGGSSAGPTLTCLERSGLLESTSYLGTEQGSRGRGSERSGDKVALGTGMGTERKWGSGWGRDGTQIGMG